MDKEQYVIEYMMGKEVKIFPQSFDTQDEAWDAIEQYGASAQTSSSLAFLAELARFRAAFGEGDLALNDLIEEFCHHLEGLPYHMPGVRREMARMLRWKLKVRE